MELAEVLGTGRVEERNTPFSQCLPARRGCASALSLGLFQTKAWEGQQGHKAGLESHILITAWRVSVLLEA